MGGSALSLTYDLLWRHSTGELTAHDCAVPMDLFGAKSAMDIGLIPLFSLSFDAIPWKMTMAFAAVCSPSRPHHCAWWFQKSTVLARMQREPSKPSLESLETVSLVPEVGNSKLNAEWLHCG